MEKFFTPGIKDRDFIRGEVPMTKEEVREIVLCKLRLNENAVFFDIGSGTGSIAVEAARLSNSIGVYAVEENPAALELMKQNKEKFSVNNMHIIQATAPDQLEKLPAPTHAFIGGTKGRLKPILEELYKKNSNMKIVMNAVSLESIAEMTSVLKTFPIENDEIIQVAVSRANKTGSYHLLQANNPVFIFSFNFAGNRK